MSPFLTQKKNLNSRGIWEGTSGDPFALGITELQAGVRMNLTDDTRKGVELFPLSFQWYISSVSFISQSVAHSFHSLLFSFQRMLLCPNLNLFTWGYCPLTLCSLSLESCSMEFSTELWISRNQAKLVDIECFTYFLVLASCYFIPLFID